MQLTSASITSPDLNVTSYRPKGPHITHVPVQTISKLAPFSALIISIIFVIYFLIRYYLLEGYLLKKIYGKIYSQMDETTRRGFVNHHIAGGTKLAILILAAYPFIDVAFMNANLHSPFAGSKTIKMGDILIIAAQALIAMYVFELFYRPKISPVSIAHHIGTIMIGQSAIALSLGASVPKDASIEFILCTVWGAFDIISEFFPHISIILYRVYPTRHQFLRSIFRASAVTTLTGTTTETILIMYLFGSLWNRWTLPFKIVTPILHLVFAAAQLWGTYVFYKMYKKQGRILETKNAETRDLEAGTTDAGESKATDEPAVNTEEVPSHQGPEAPSQASEAGLREHVGRAS